METEIVLPNLPPKHRDVSKKTLINGGMHQGGERLRARGGPGVCYAGKGAAQHAQAIRSQALGRSVGALEGGVRLRGSQGGAGNARSQGGGRKAMEEHHLRGVETRISWHR